MIDTDKPLQLADGSAATYIRNHGDQIVVILGGSHVYRYFNAITGKHMLGYLPNLQNVPEVSPAAPSFDPSRTFKTRSGQPARLLGKMDDGRLVVQVGFFTADGVGTIYRADGRRFGNPKLESTDDLINVAPIQTKAYRNVYADGTIGETAHSTIANCKARTKFGKVAIGVLCQKAELGKIVEAILLPSEPVKRTKEFPKGQPNPWA